MQLEPCQIRRAQSVVPVAGSRATTMQSSVTAKSRPDPYARLAFPLPKVRYQSRRPVASEYAVTLATSGRSTTKTVPSTTSG